MNEDELFINKRYVGDLDMVPMFINYKGILKKIGNNPLMKRMVTNENVYYRLNDLDEYLQESLKDMAVTPLELNKRVGNKNSFVVDQENVLIYVNGNTELIPIVGNILPSDEINAYTVIIKDGKPYLKSILVCWGCHWSDLFTGRSNYKKNVFALASDLSLEQRNLFSDNIITLNQTLEFLETGKVLKHKR